MGKTDAQIVREAADLIEKPGAWFQGTYFRDVKTWEATNREAEKAECMCAVGAIWKACLDQDRMAKIWTKIETKTGLNIPMFNDAPGQTASEVVQLLRDAADQIDG